MPAKSRQSDGMVVGAAHHGLSRCIGQKKHFGMNRLTWGHLLVATL
jgi:hypothetical protein